MARPTLEKKFIDGQLYYFVDGEPYTNKNKAREAVTSAYKKGAEEETSRAKAMRKKIEDRPFWETEVFDQEWDNLPPAEQEEYIKKLTPKEKMEMRAFINSKENPGKSSEELRADNRTAMKKLRLDFEQKEFDKKQRIDRQKKSYEDMRNEEAEYLKKYREEQGSLGKNVPPESEEQLEKIRSFRDKYDKKIADRKAVSDYKLMRLRGKEGGINDDTDSEWSMPPKSFKPNGQGEEIPDPAPGDKWYKGWGKPKKTKKELAELRRRRGVLTSPYKTKRNK